MDLDSNAYYKLCSPDPDRDDRYNKIIKAIHLLQHKYDNETPEMWCSRIRGPFRKILEENPEIFSKNGYIRMYAKFYEDGKGFHPSGNLTNYIYCSVCDSLVFIPERLIGEFLYRDGHLKRCIVSKANPIEHARKKEILQSIDRREFNIWQYKQYILQEEAEMKRLQLELSSQSLSHSEKDKLASISYDFDSRTIGYETYKQDKMTIAENIMPSAPSFKPACISITSGNQEMVSPNSYQSSNYKSDTGELFISSQYAKQPKGTMLRLRDGRVLTVV
ncbi:hypothetical protein RhiirA5_437888 [Rhizophagus irregularis]|uniref:Uncharacterized protein n=4 Tax=Rhizophagus irregularis TaxID=588596 RepID=A0A2N0NJW3_9GLOM|nr:hypothetical protein GLOIN_2v1479550 [Rhizophagus irregularis DAOM 181602=DAOM 197198]EXX61202.1 hypothetical protein RirG_173330 [Rhizophagus irregularis DAOM 197198w]PKB94862.1 hypothetical protein RhiirA5_437888 [Rhizophagus irregularis]POG70080.1 hypothetical protein GLOIN_2v1479550 [Rhizophagus irregularis DAOM 181602=DAOM 197198]GET66973.1 hypothetical protein GLOIN_2v1479550 [Rhizophagus irregularis DAOM 181602=DAOM 197198]|eukprot:XP_025176946.1 hypothetical protein GLOIN_2v1479550 [Rhizophagus irregularis DAOM 181602=DAOM 197198]